MQCGRAALSYGIQRSGRQDLDGLRMEFVSIRIRASLEVTMQPQLSGV